MEKDPRTLTDKELNALCRRLNKAGYIDGRKIGTVLLAIVKEAETERKAQPFGGRARRSPIQRWLDDKSPGGHVPANPRIIIERIVRLGLAAEARAKKKAHKET